MIQAGNPGEIVAYGPLLVAIPIAVAAGLVSFLSPCCLPLLPGYLAYVTGSAGAEADEPTHSSRPVSRSGNATSTRPPLVGATMAGTMLFVLGFAAVFTSYGAAFGAVGTVLLAHQEHVTRVLGALTVLLGLMLAGVLNLIPFSGRTLRLRYRPKVGVASAPLLGVLFAVGCTPCIGPTLAAVLALSTSTTGVASPSFSPPWVWGVPSGCTKRLAVGRTSSSAAVASSSWSSGSWR